MLPGIEKNHWRTLAGHELLDLCGWERSPADPSGLSLMISGREDVVALAGSPS